MINLMYLVLTALLALNVSNEILNAFKVINKSINRSNENIDMKNQGTVASFEEALKDPKLKEDKRKRVEVGLQLAQQAQVKADSIIKIMNGYKETIITNSGGYRVDENGNTNLKSPEDLDAATFYMVDQKNGDKMKSMLETFKSTVSALVPIKTDSGMYLSTKNARVDSLLPINFDVEKTPENKGDWKYANFHMVPAIGAATIIDKYVNDVRNSVSIVMDEIWAVSFADRDNKTDIRNQTKTKTKVDVKVFDKYKAIVQPRSTYLLPGEKFYADIMVGAYKEKDNQTIITVNGSPRPVVNGIANFESASSKVGENKLVIGGSYFDPNINQRVDLEPYNISYFVGEPSGSISLDKMNVFYIGVENPITVSASGVLMSNLTIAPSEGLNLTPTGGTGKYAVTTSLPPGSKAYISLSGKRSDGSVENFGKYEYRIKRIPDPVFEFMGKPCGSAIRADIARLQLGPAAVLYNFDFDAKFQVMGFTLGTISRKSGELLDYPVKGGLFSKEAKEGLNKLKPKDKIYFDDIQVMGPDKKLRSLQMSCNFTLI
jgi:gliding motility-associated protein GldM